MILDLTVILVEADSFWSSKTISQEQADTFLDAYDMLLEEGLQPAPQYPMMLQDLTQKRNVILNSSHLRSIELNRDNLPQEAAIPV